MFSKIINTLVRGLVAGIIILLLLMAYFGRGTGPMENGISQFWLEELSDILFYWLLAVAVVGIINIFIVRARQISSESKNKIQLPVTSYQLLIYFLFFSLGIFSIYKLLFLPGVIGFRHDWSVPVFSLDGFYLNWRYLWRETDLGASTFNQGYLTTWMYDLYLWTLSLIGISGALYSKLSIILAVALSGISAYQLCLYLSLSFKKVPATSYQLPATFIPALFYALTPILFDKIVAGQITYIFAYSISPWILLYYFKSDQKKFIIKNALIAGLLFAISATQIHFLFMISAVLLIYLLFADFKINLIKFIVIVWIITFLIHAPIVITFILNFFDNIGGFASNLAVSDWLKVLSSPMAAILVLASIANPYFRLALGENHYWPTLSLFIPILAFSALLWNPRDKKSVFVIIIVFLASFIAMGTVNLQNLSAISIFRELYHLFWMIAIAYVILLTQSISYVSMKLKNKPWLLVTRPQRLACMAGAAGCWLLTLLIILYSFPFFTGDFGKQLQVYNPDPAYKKLQEKLKNDRENYRVLWLPAHQKNRPISLGFGGTDGLIKGSPKPPLPQEGNILSAGDPRSMFRNQIISKMYYGDQNNTVSQLLAMANVKYIVQRDDFIDQFPDYTLLKSYPDLKQKWTNENLKNNLKKNSDIKLTETIGPINLYENANRLPYIYAIEKENFQLKSNVSTVEPGIYANQYYDAGKGWIRGWYWWWRDSRFASSHDKFIYTEKKGAEIEIPIKQQGSFDLWIKGYSLDKENELELRIANHELPRPLIASDSVAGGRITNISNNNWEWKRIESIELLPVADYQLLITNIKGRNGIAQIVLAPKGQKFTAPSDNLILTDDYQALNYKKINPAYYQIEIEIDNPFWLVFLEGYDKDWKIKGLKGDYDHQIVNGYANGFYIDQTGEYELDLVYGKQKWYDAGLIVSLITFLISIILIIQLLPLLLTLSRARHR